MAGSKGSRIINCPEYKSDDVDGDDDDPGCAVIFPKSTVKQFCKKQTNKKTPKYRYPEKIRRGTNTGMESSQRVHNTIRKWEKYVSQYHLT